MYGLKCITDFFSAVSGKILFKGVRKAWLHQVSKLDEPKSFISAENLKLMLYQMSEAEAETFLE